MHDPHLAERRQIEERLLRDYPTLAGQISKEEEEEEEGEEGEGGEEEYEEEYKQEEYAPHSLDPSSEAEALSNVASGIAASLGLVQEQHYPQPVIIQVQGGAGG